MTAPTPRPRRGRHYRGESAQQRRAERRGRLLEAARIVIGRQGFKAATVRMICSEAGLTQRYYYESFASAEDLLVALYLQEQVHLMQVLRQAVAEPTRSNEQLAEAALDATFAHLQAQPEAARILFLEIFGVSARVDQTYREGTQRIIDLLVAFAGSRLAPERLVGIDLRLQGAAVVGAIIFLAMQWILSGYARPRQELVANLMVLVRALLSRPDSR